MINDIENFGWSRFFSFLFILHDFHKCLFDITSYGINRVRVLCIILNIIMDSLFEFRLDCLFNLIVFIFKLQNRPITHKPISLRLNQSFMRIIEYLQLPILPRYRPIIRIILQIVIIRLVPNIKDELNLHLDWFLTTQCIWLDEGNKRFALGNIHGV